MKKSIAISTIVALHGLFIGAMLVQSGCNSEPESTKPNQALTSIEEIEGDTNASNDPADTVEEIVIEQPEEEILPPEGSPTLRVPPTRPAWNSNEGNNTVIVPNQPQKVAPKADDSKVNELVTPVQPVASNLESYVVQSGDTLSKISKQFNVSLDKLLQTNALTRGSRIMIGQKIYIPAEKLKVQQTIKPIEPTQNTKATTNSSSEIYTVVGGDSLSRIAYNYKTTISSIMQLNNLKNHNIRIGQKLKVQRNNKTSPVSNIVIAKTTAPTTLPSGEIAYTVKSGDTLGGIAIRYKTSVKALMEKNNIKDARKLRIGQVLRIVAKTTAPKPVEAKKPSTTTPAPVTPAVKPTTVQPVTPVAPAVTTVPVAPAKPVAPTVVAPTTSTLEDAKPIKDEDPSSNINILEL